MHRAAALLAVIGLPAAAASGELAVSVEIPRLDSAEYHPPYVAIWVEKPDQTAMGTLAVWYDVALPNNEGLEWLKDIRTWWRKAGRAMTLPADGVSGATRPPGVHNARFSDSSPVLKGLPEGDYNLVVEASRELGGREIVRIPFVWRENAENLSVEGSSELGAVALAVKP